LLHKGIGFSNSGFEVLLNNGHGFPEIFTDKKKLLVKGAVNICEIRVYPCPFLMLFIG